MTARTLQLKIRRLSPAVPGALAAAAVGLGCGAVLKPTPAECGLPRPPQLMHMSDSDLAVLERTPRLVWPSVQAPWRT